jgi:hypothetical protein
MKFGKRWWLLALALAGFALLEDPALQPLVAADSKAGGPVTVQWRLLRTLDLATGEVPAELKKVDGATVKIAGYMVPLEDDDQQDADEYLIVPIAGGCIHTPPPPPHQIVYCRMTSKKKIRVSMFEPQWFEGKLTIAKTGSPYGAVSYQMAVANVVPYQAK